MNAPKTRHPIAGAIAAIAATVATAALGPTVRAAEQQLEFKLVTMPVEVKNYEVANFEGQNVVLLKARGVAYLKDGRIASKEFVHSGDIGKGSGPFFGYSTYTFEDGSTLSARYAGTQRAGQPVHGDYTVVGGTGIFAGAKGTGSFDAVPHKLKGASLFDGRFAITTP